MKQYFTNYLNWEDYKNGMWRTVDKSEEQEITGKAITFMSDSENFGLFMDKVIELWPECTKVNLTNSAQNRKSWIGQAACCMAINCPENVTRSAWWKLTEEQRINANLQADKSIKKWEKSYSG